METNKIIVLSIFGYIANIFLNRWLNKKAWQMADFDIMPNMWFLSILTTALLIAGMCEEKIKFKYDKKPWNWFAGKNWKK